VAVRVSSVKKEWDADQVVVMSKEKIPQENALLENLCQLMDTLGLARDSAFRMWIGKGEDLVDKYTEIKDMKELLKIRAGRLAGPIGRYPTQIDQVLEKPSHFE
jgi:hypothetical protein